MIPHPRLIMLSSGVTDDVLYHIDGLAVLIWCGEEPSVPDMCRYATYYASDDGGHDQRATTEPPKGTTTPSLSMEAIEPTVIVADALVSFSRSHRCVIYCYDRGTTVESISPWQLNHVLDVSSLKERSTADDTTQRFASGILVNAVLLLSTAAGVLVSPGGLDPADDEFRTLLRDSLPRQVKSPTWSAMMCLCGSRAAKTQLYDGFRSLHVGFVEMLRGGEPAAEPSSRRVVPVTTDGDLVRKSARQQTLEHAKFLQHEARRLLSRSGMSLVGSALSHSTPPMKAEDADLIQQISGFVAARKTEEDSQAAAPMQPAILASTKVASPPVVPNVKQLLLTERGGAQCPYCIALGSAHAPVLSPTSLRKHLLDSHLGTQPASPLAAVNADPRPLSVQSFVEAAQSSSQNSSGEESSAMLRARQLLATFRGPTFRGQAGGGEVDLPLALPASSPAWTSDLPPTLQGPSSGKVRFTPPDQLMTDLLATGFTDARCKWCGKLAPTDHPKRCGFRQLRCQTCKRVVLLRDRKVHTAQCGTM